MIKGNRTCSIRRNSVVLQQCLSPHHNLMCLSCLRSCEFLFVSPSNRKMMGCGVVWVKAHTMRICFQIMIKEIVLNMLSVYQSSRAYFPHQIILHIQRLLSSLRLAKSRFISNIFFLKSFLCSILNIPPPLCSENKQRENKEDNHRRIHHFN